MTIPILCPNCDNNKTCRAPVSLRVVSNDSPEIASFVNAISGQAAPTTPLSKHHICSGVAKLIEEALSQNAETAVIVIPGGLEREELKLIGSIINCRAIQLLAHRAPSALKLIAVRAAPSDVEALSEGMKSAHPLCISCYQAVEIAK